MRITQNISSNNALYNLQRGQKKLDYLQNLTASGQNVNQPSDDPLSSRTLVDVADKIRAIDQHASNIDKANSWLQITNTGLEGMASIINQAVNVANKINTGSTDATIRQDANNQLNELKKQFVDMANTQYGDVYVFGGANNLVPPFNKTDNTYAGDSTQLSVEVAQNTDQSLNITGDRLVKGTGTSPSYGVVDILKTFDDLIAAVGDQNTASNVTAINQGNIDMQSGAKQVNIATSDVLSRTTRLANMKSLNDNNRNTLLTITTNIQNVDLSKLGVELSNQKTAFEAALSTTAKVSQLSLLNYLN